MVPRIESNGQKQVAAEARIARKRHDGSVICDLQLSRTLGLV